MEKNPAANSAESGQPNSTYECLTPKSSQILVLGVGNLLLKDEGFGIHVIEEMQKQRQRLSLPSNIEMVDGATLGLDLLYYIEKKDKLIVIDVINTGAPPGTIFRFKPEDIKSLSPQKISFHQITLLDVLSMAEHRGNVPSTIIFAVQPKEVNWGMELSSELKEKIPEVINLVVKEIKEVKS